MVCGDAKCRRRELLVRAAAVNYVNAATLLADSRPPACPLSSTDKSPTSPDNRIAVFSTLLLCLPPCYRTNSVLFVHAWLFFRRPK